MRKLTCLCGLALSLTVTCAFAQSKFHDIRSPIRGANP
jgi:hypothetical protein